MHMLLSAQIWQQLKTPFFPPSVSEYYHWAARYNTGLLIKLTPKGVVFSCFLSFFEYYQYVLEPTLGCRAR